MQRARSAKLNPLYDCERRINDFAARSFRNVADRDYIVARFAARASLHTQFLWSAHQAFEKYLKYLLLVNRIPARHVRHHLQAAISLFKHLPFKIDLPERSLTFVEYIADQGENRYLDVPYHVLGQPLLELDMAVWYLRRYCQMLVAGPVKLTEKETEQLELNRATVLASDARPPHLFGIDGGYLEHVLASRQHPARPTLIWQNCFFTLQRRSRIKVQKLMHFENSPLFLFPQMLDELTKLIHIPKDLRAAYREHLSTSTTNPS